MTKFKPVSLSNVVHKLISKVLANHLKMILPHIISEIRTHSFLKGLLLTMFMLPLSSCTTLTIRETTKIDTWLLN